MRIPLVWCGHILRLLGAPAVAGVGFRRLPSGLAAALCALALGACAPEYKDYGYAASPSSAPRPVKAARRPTLVPPSAELLAQPRQPSCEAELADARKMASLAPPPPDANAELALRITLEYERECYKQAEARLRAQLQTLQAWTVETVKASKRRE